jgi:hypothetical protein
MLYTRAYDQVKDYYYNEFDAGPSWRPASNPSPHRVVWSGVWELPFGKGRTWMTNGFARHVVGGWQLSWIYQFQSGAATNWPNAFFYGDIKNIGDLLKHDEVHSKDIHVWFDPSIAYRGTGSIPQGFQGLEGRAAMAPGQFQQRVFPVRLDALRGDGFREWDAKILRKFRGVERLTATFSVDLLNATNHTNFDVPNTDPTSLSFGNVTNQLGMSRIIQLNLRFDF